MPAYIIKKGMDIEQCKYVIFTMKLKHTTSTMHNERLHVTDEYRISELDTG
jgi:hypothetical protein